MAEFSGAETEKNPVCEVVFTAVKNVAFWVNKPLLNMRNVEQMKMYVCTLKNIYSSRCSHIAVQVGTELNCIGNAVVYIQSQQ